MIRVQTVREIISYLHDRYDKDERRIVGIMLARYNIQSVKEAVDECYLYWHYNTGKILDVFWCGYGVGPRPKEMHIVDVSGGNYSVYFDLKKFIEAKDELNNLIKGKYNDHLQLILVNYYDGKLHFDESVRIDLEARTDESKVELRGFMEWLTSECSSEFNIASLMHKMRLDKFKSAIRSITVSDVINTAIGVAGIW